MAPLPTKKNMLNKRGSQGCSKLAFVTGEFIEFFSETVYGDPSITYIKSTNLGKYLNCKDKMVTNILKILELLGFIREDLPGNMEWTQQIRFILPKIIDIKNIPVILYSKKKTRKARNPTFKDIIFDLLIYLEREKSLIISNFLKIFKGGKYFKHRVVYQSTNIICEVLLGLTYVVKRKRVYIWKGLI